MAPNHWFLSTWNVAAAADGTPRPPAVVVTAREAGQVVRLVHDAHREAVDERAGIASSAPAGDPPLPMRPEGAEYAEETSYVDGSGIRHAAYTIHGTAEESEAVESIRKAGQVEIDAAIAASDYQRAAMLDRDRSSSIERARARVHHEAMVAMHEAYPQRVRILSADGKAAR